MNLKGILISTICHIVLLLMLSFTINNAINSNTKINNMQVQLAPLDKITNNVVNKNHTPQTKIKKPEVKKPVAKNAKVANKTAKKVDNSPKKQVITKQDPKKAKLPTEEKVIKEKKPKPITQTKKENVDNLDNLLKNLEETIEKSKQKEKTEKDNSEPDNDDGFQKLSATQEDLIRAQIMENWHVPAGIFKVNEMWVKLNIKVSIDGKIQYVKDIAWSNHANSSSYQIFIESAKRAVLKCGELKGLDKKDYDSWKELNLIFNLKDMLNEMG